MKLFEYKTRDDYVKTQIERSRKKMGYCKVYFSDVIRFRQLIELDRYGHGAAGSGRPAIKNILCLGVRSGAEVDLFRAAFFGPLLRLKRVQNYARRRDTGAFSEPKIKMAHRLGLGSGSRRDGRVMGVEINPDAKRDDVWIGSFDELPEEWAGRFNLLYSNSLDHSQEPRKTFAEWRRVAAPGAYVILGFTEGNMVSDHDPFGGIDYTTLQELWDAPVVFFSDSYSQNGYREICFRLDPR